MRIPRDLSGDHLARLLRKYDYKVSRQTGSHMRLSSQFMGAEHHITIPAHKSLKIGTLAGILTTVATYLKRTREEVAGELFD